MKQKNQEIYLLYTCNIWKEYSSMSFVMATTDIDNIIKVIRKLIKEGSIVYQTEEWSATKQIKEFNKDIAEADDIYEIIQRCDYCYLNVVNDGEEQ